MMDPELDSGPIGCPRCGDPAEYERNGAEIEVDCAACGRYPITPEQLEEALDLDQEDDDR